MLFRSYLADLESATLEQLKAFHAAHYGPLSMRIVAVGDLDEIGFDAALDEAFRGWSGGKAVSSAPRANALVAGRVEKVAMPGKTSVSVLIGQPSGLQHHDPDYLACNLGTAVFGSGFFSARLLDIIRNKEGLTYGIGASLRADTFSDEIGRAHV